MQHVDVAVVGLGGIGSAAAWFAARRGASVIGFERFQLGGHDRGASHDHSRIIRHSYHTPHYVELTRGAYDAWRQVEATSGKRCVHVTGGIDVFPRDAAIDVSTYRDSMLACAIAFDEMDGAEAMRRWPVWHMPVDATVLHQADTGIVSPAATVQLMQSLASASGADLRGECAVEAIEPNADRVTVVLGNGTRLTASHVIVAADAWTSSLLRPLGVDIPLTVTKEQVSYYSASSLADFAAERFPVWIWMDDPSFYGFPTFGRPGVKIAQDCGGTPVDPDLRGFDPDEAILERTNRFAADAFGERLGPVEHTVTCLYTLTPDRDFVVDSLREAPNVHVGLGAGHGYKFAAWFGRTLAALACGAEHGADLAAFTLDRTALTDPSWEANWLV